MSCRSDWPRPFSSSPRAVVRAVPRGHVAGRLLRNVPCLWRPLFCGLGLCVGARVRFLGGWGCLLFNASVLNALPNGLCGFLNKFVALVAFQVCNCRCVTDTSFKRMLFSVRGKPSMWVDVRMGPRPMVRTTAVAFARSSTRRETVLLL